MKQNIEYYTPNKIYIHKSLLYTCKFIGYQRNKPTYEIVTTNEISGFKVGDKFTPNDPEKWFDITDTFIPPTPVNEGQPVQGERFTPGEWYIGIDRETPGLTKYFFDRNGDETEEEAKANAVLIASAPTLLKENEQLKEYANYIGDKIAAGDDEILTFQQWLDNPALSQTETK